MATDQIVAAPIELFSNHAAIFYMLSPTEAMTYLGCSGISDITIMGEEPGELVECPDTNRRGTFNHTGYKVGNKIVPKFSATRPFRQINQLWQLAENGLTNWRLNYAESGSEDDVENWLVALLYFMAQNTNRTLEGGKALTSGDTMRQNTGLSVQALVGFYIYRWSNYSRQTTVEDQLGNGIAFWPQVDAGVLRRFPGQHGIVTVDAAAAAEANVLQTITGGSTWAAMSNDPLTGGTFENVGFPICVDLPQSSAKRVLVFTTETRAANNPIMCYTDDLGATAWTEIELVGGNAAYDAEFVTAARKIRDSLFLVGTDLGTVLYSKDKGINWTLASYPGTNDVRGFARGPDGRIWAVGDGTEFSYSDDDGATWTAAAVALSGAGTGVAVNYEGHVYVIDGTDLKVSRDRGATLDTISVPGTTTALKAVQFDKYGVTGCMIQDDAAGNDRILRTEDGGLTWIAQTSGTSNTGLNDAVMPDGLPHVVHSVGDVVATTWIERLFSSNY